MTNALRRPGAEALGPAVRLPADLLAYRAMFVDVMAKVKALRDKGASLADVLAAKLTAPYDRTTMGDTPQSRARPRQHRADEPLTETARPAPESACRAV